MPDSQGMFIAVGVVGFLVLLISMVFGELFEHGLEHALEVAHELPASEESANAHLVRPSWASSRVLAASLVGFSSAGFIAAFLGLPALISWPLAAVGFLTVGTGTYVLILKPLHAQQYNSLMSRYSYVGREAVVTLDILTAGTGQVTFHDRQGARVTQTATSDLKDAVPKGTTVTIVDLVPGGVVVHHNSFSN